MNCFNHYCIACIACLFVCCTKNSADIDDAPQIDIVFPELKYIASQVGEEYSLTFDAAATWQIESNVIWIEFLTELGRYSTLYGVADDNVVVSFTVTADNQSQEDVEASITLTIDDQSAVIATVLREGVDPSEDNSYPDDLGDQDDSLEDTSDLGTDNESDVEDAADLDSDTDLDTELENDDETEPQEDDVPSTDPDSDSDPDPQIDLDVDTDTTPDVDHDSDITTDTTDDLALKFAAQSADSGSTISKMDSTHAMFEYFTTQQSAPAESIYILEYTSATSENIEYPFDFNWDKDSIDYGPISTYALGEQKWLVVSASSNYLTVTMNSSIAASGYIILRQSGECAVAIYCIQH